MRIGAYCAILRHRVLTLPKGWVSTMFARALLHPKRVHVHCRSRATGTCSRELCLRHGHAAGVRLNAPMSRSCIHGSGERMDASLRICGCHDTFDVIDSADVTKVALHLATFVAIVPLSPLSLLSPSAPPRIVILFIFTRPDRTGALPETHGFKGI